MKKKIIEVLYDISYTTYNETGDKLHVIDYSDAEKIADRIVNLFDTPSVIKSVCAHEWEIKYYDDGDYAMQCRKCGIIR